jgi:uncharacterized DUF497 family protein
VATVVNGNFEWDDDKARANAANMSARSATAAEESLYTQGG